MFLQSNLAKPTQITLTTNEYCNLKCRTCFAWVRGDHGSITLAEIQTVLTELREWLGIFKIELVGGEVLLRKDFIDILYFAKSLGIHISLVTNGTLINKFNARVLVETCDVVNLSLNGINPETHDYMRGHNGAYELMMSAIDNLVEAREKYSKNTFLNISYILSDYNKSEIVPLIKWAKTKGINGLSAQAISHPYWKSVYDPKWKTKGKFWPKTQKDVEEMHKVIDELIDYSRQPLHTLGNTTQHLLEMKKYFQTDINSDGQIDITENSGEDLYYLEQLKRIEAGLISKEKTSTNSYIPVKRPTDLPTTISAEMYKQYYLDSIEENDRCKIGYHNLSIGYDGNVRICHTMEPIGNIRSDSILNIWFGHQASEQRRAIKACDKGCKVLLCNTKQKENELMPLRPQSEPSSISL